VIRFSFVVIAALALTEGFFQVKWTDSSQGAISIRAAGIEAELAECLESSREAKIRFEMRMCRKRSSWFDSCATSRSEHHSIGFDAVTESYRVVSDRHDDEADPVAVGFSTRAEAVKAAAFVKDVSLPFLARDEEGLLDHSRAYIQARAVVVCKGSVNRTVAQLSQILTLGIVNVVESDSGWQDFVVRQGNSEVVKGGS
jgi:hypothetical protein